MEENKENKEEMAIHASVLSLSGGMKTYENVSMVRIVSRDYNIPVSYTHLIRTVRPDHDSDRT